MGAFVLVCAALGASLLALGHRAPTSNQSAEAVLYIHHGYVHHGNATPGNTDIETARDAVLSAPVLSAVRESLRQSGDLDSLRKRIRVSNNGDSAIVTIITRDQDTHAAVLLADTVVMQAVFFLRSMAVGNLVAPDLASGGSGVNTAVASELLHPQRAARISRAVDEDRFVSAGPAVAVGSVSSNTGAWALLGALLGATVGAAAIGLANRGRRQRQQAEHQPYA